VFSISIENELRREEGCLTYHASKSDGKVPLENCNGSKDQKWLHNKVKKTRKYNFMQKIYGNAMFGFI
jgi:hypothetical protein